jgi:hypothetical protein
LTVGLWLNKEPAVREALTVATIPRQRYNSSGEWLVALRQAQGGLSGELATELSLFDEVCFYFVERNALLVLARPGNQDILNVLPERAVLSQVNKDGDLAPFSVGYELNSGHGFILLPVRPRGT